MTTYCHAHDPGTPQQIGYGLGLFRLDADGEEVWASLGLFIGSTALVAYSPAEQDIVAIVGNLSQFDSIGVWTDLTEVSRERSTD